MANPELAQDDNPPPLLRFTNKQVVRTLKKGKRHVFVIPTDTVARQDEEPITVIPTDTVAM